jgi:hypothetical protein
VERPASIWLKSYDSRIYTSDESVHASSDSDSDSDDTDDDDNEAQRKKKRKRLPKWVRKHCQISCLTRLLQAESTKKFLSASYALVIKSSRLCKRVLALQAVRILRTIITLSAFALLASTVSK